MKVRDIFSHSAGLSGCSPLSPELQAVIVTVYMSNVNTFQVSAWNDGATPGHCIPSSTASSHVDVSYNST